MIMKETGLSPGTTAAAARLRENAETMCVDLKELCWRSLFLKAYVAKYEDQAKAFKELGE